MLEGWHRATRQRPCPVCKHPDWCIIADNEAVCVCYRVESERMAKSGSGWIHRLKELPASNAKATTPNPIPNAASNATTTPDIGAYFAGLPTTWCNLQERMCGYLERELGLPKEIMQALDWRWDRSAKAVAIPMRDADGLVTGIRYRALKSGAKWAMRGSKDGLFYDPEFIPYDPDELFICEGPTDCAAAMACGFWCVGRSSCGTGRDALRDLVRNRHVRRVTIIADDDKPKPRPGGGTWRPGYDGAVRLAEQLSCAYRIVLPPCGFKDLRDWYRAGTLNAQTFNGMVLGNGWHGPGSGK